jgi:tetratricopeptide (TPR) repeat protein
LWSQTYDRDLKDIFAIQDEIARAIGDELKVRVIGAGSAGTSGGGTKNLQAHDLYLRGLAQWQTRSADGLLAARESFEQAIAADPGYADAWAGLALCYAVISDYTLRISAADANSRAREAAERALVLAPTLAEAYAALGSAESYVQHLDTGVALLKRAIVLKSSFATAHQWLGTTLMVKGEPEESLASLERARALDPRSIVVAANYSSMLIIAGRNEDAIAACTPALQFAPNSILCVANIALAHLLNGKPELARPYYDRWAKIVGASTDRQVAELYDVLGGKGDRHAYARKLAATPQLSWNDPASGNMFGETDVVGLLMLLDEQELALRYIDAQDPRVTLAWALLLPKLDPIRCDPRFRAKVSKLKIKDLSADRLCT